MKATIFTKDQQIVCTFTFSFFERTDTQQQLDAQTFYMEYAKTIHDKTVEMKIDDVSPFSIADMAAKDAHVHEGNDGNWYICYPSQLTLDEAKDRAIHWSLITAFHMKYQADISLFENFDRWLTKKRNFFSIFYIFFFRRKKNNISAFNAFSLWIEEFMEWSVETTEE